MEILGEILLPKGTLLNFQEKEKRFIQMSYFSLFRRNSYLNKWSIERVRKRGSDFESRKVKNMSDQNKEGTDI